MLPLTVKTSCGIPMTTTEIENLTKLLANEHQQLSSVIEAYWPVD